LSERSTDSAYNHPGVDITVSSGDSGYGVEYPAASQYVTAVGGTTLTQASNSRGWSETAWSGAGSGCWAYEAAARATSSSSTALPRGSTAGRRWVAPA
jgi:subtilase family serine protease